MSIPLEGFLLIVGYGLLRLAIPFLIVLALCKVLPLLCSGESESTRHQNAH